MAALIRPVARHFAVLLSVAMPVASSAAVAPPLVEKRPEQGVAQIAPARPAVERWRVYIAEASRRFAVPQAWIAAVMQVESAGQTMLAGRPIVSRAGAMGLMQVMPATWAQMRQHLGLGTNAHDPHDNIMAGAAYLRAMFDRFGYPGLFAAYNAGPGRYAEHLRSGRPLAAETRGYIAQLARAPASLSMPPAILSGERLFFALGSQGKPVDGEHSLPGKTPANPIFVPLSRAREGEQ